MPKTLTVVITDEQIEKEVDWLQVLLAENNPESISKFSRLVLRKFIEEIFTHAHFTHLQTAAGRPKIKYVINKKLLPDKFKDFSDSDLDFLIQGGLSILPELEAIPNCVTRISYTDGTTD